MLLNSNNLLIVITKCWVFLRGFVFLLYLVIPSYVHHKFAWHISMQNEVLVLILNCCERMLSSLLLFFFSYLFFLFFWSINFCSLHYCSFNWPLLIILISKTATAAYLLVRLGIWLYQPIRFIISHQCCRHPRVCDPRSLMCYLSYNMALVHVFSNSTCYILQLKIVSIIPLPCIGGIHWMWQLLAYLFPCVKGYFWCYHTSLVALLFLSCFKNLFRVGQMFIL